MAIVNFQYGYAFLAEKHTASCVLSDVLWHQPGGDIVSPHHVTMDDLSGGWSILRQFSSKLKTFCVVRNPADILVTMYLANSFQEYMRFVSLDPACVFFQHVDDVDVVLRYENLGNDLNNFLKGVGAPEVVIPYKKEYVTGGKNPWPSYYEEEDIDHIIKAFPEIDRFGYADTIRQEWEAWQLQMTS